MSIILSIQTLSAQSIFTWKSDVSERQLPYRNFYIIGINESDIDDKLLEDWFKSEIKEQFNYVKEIHSFTTDTNQIFQYEQWMSQTKFKTSDVILTYSISKESIKKKKRATKYNPIIQEPYYMSLRGYLSQKNKNIQKDIYEEDVWFVDIKIYHPVTYNLLYSAKSKTFQSSTPQKKAFKFFEKMIQKAIQQDIINDDMY